MATESETSDSNVIDLKQLQSEAEQVADYQIEWAMQSDEDLLRLLRFNVLALGVIISLVGYGLNTGFLEINRAVTIGIIAGGVFWMLSTVIAVVAYKFTKIVRGFEEWEGVDLAVLSFSPPIVEQEGFDECQLLCDYQEIIRTNQKELDCKYTLHAGSVLLLAISIVIIGASFGTMLDNGGSVFYVIERLMIIIGGLLIFPLFVLVGEFTEKIDHEKRRDIFDPYDKGGSLTTRGYDVLSDIPGILREERMEDAETKTSQQE